MAAITVKPHATLLKALYDISKPVPKGVKDPMRFRFDGERRIMDVSRILWKYWPITSELLRAKYGDKFIFEIGRMFSKGGFLKENVETTVGYILFEFIKKKNETWIQEVRRYEGLKKGSLEETKTPSKKVVSLLESKVKDFRVAKFSYDIISFEKVIQFYVDLHSPDLFIKKLVPDTSKVTLAVYKRNGKIYSLNISRLV